MTGAQQRRVLQALAERRDHDVYDITTLTDSVGVPGARKLRARWRWYTIGMLGLIDHGAPESQRASIHQTVRALAQAGHLHTATTPYPYGAPFTPHRDECGDAIGGLDLSELCAFDPRWPPRHGRRLWFRLQPTPKIPSDDQTAVLHWLAATRPDEYEDFAASLDRSRAWESDMGRFLRWLLCGHPHVHVAPTARQARQRPD